MGIKSVVKDGVSGLLNEAMWSACEMSSVWMQSELSQNQTQERILAYAAELCDHIPSDFDFDYFCLADWVLPLLPSFFIIRYFYIQSSLPASIANESLVSSLNVAWLICCSRNC
ncbi:unnamed protein product [Brassica rapa]|uniref:Saposin-like type B region 1 domain-containing protein n=1 Tax=Brassica campestris TaxID=3711 RepID=A0A8D9HQW8_BRACM|nr:unnamed protein product [Brassica rapa]